jgi:hypothetical protein
MPILVLFDDTIITASVLTSQCAPCTKQFRISSGHPTKLRAKPRPMPANVFERTAPHAVGRCIGWRWRGVERAMGIENTAGAHSPFGIMKLQARRELRTIFV